MVDYLPLVIAIVAGSVSIASLVIQSRRDRHKNSADAATTYETLTAAQAARISAQGERIGRLESEVDELNVALRESLVEVEALRCGVEVLVSQLRANRIVPAWKPGRPDDLRTRASDGVLP